MKSLPYSLLYNTRASGKFSIGSAGSAWHYWQQCLLLLTRASGKYDYIELVTVITSNVKSDNGHLPEGYGIIHLWIPIKIIFKSLNLDFGNE